MKRLFQVLFSLIATLLVPHLAFAETYSVLNPPAINNGTDLSIQYLQDIFGVVDGVLHGSGSQIMGHMFLVFNIGALILGGIVIIYTIVAGILYTAHEGEPLGRNWSSLWIPIRTALGIALLLPKASGYSVIQICLMWVIVQGVALADSVWDSALLYLAQGGMLVRQELQPNTNVVDTSAQVFRSEVCMYALQNILQKSYDEYTAQGNKAPVVPYFPATITPIKTSPLPTCPNVNGPCLQIPGKASDAGYNTVYDSLQGICGNIAWGNTADISKIPGINAALSKELQQNQTIAIQQMILDLEGPAQTVVQTQLQLGNNTTTIPPVSDVLQPTVLGNAAEDYQGIIEPTLAAIAGGGGNNNNVSQALLKQASDWGWIEAGTFYPVLTNTNNNLQSAAGTKINASGSAQTISDSFGPNGSELKNILPSFTNSAYLPQVVSLFKSDSSLEKFIQNAKSSYTVNAGLKGNNQTAAQALQVIQQIGGHSGTVLSLVFGPLVGPLIGILNSFVALGTSQISNFNPVVAIGLLGGSLISLVAQVWIAGAISAGVLTGALGAIPCIEEASVPMTVFMWIVPFLWAILGALFVNGCVMAFYIPMIPFIIFTFTAIGWFIGVIEAMAAGPIIALGITHPEGQPIMGKADTAVMLLAGIFLRPSLMIIGFIAGIILSYVSIWFLNQGFFEAFTLSAITNFSGVIAFLIGIPALLFMYVALVIAILNQSFALIYLLGDRVLGWLGAQSQQIGDMAAKGLQAAESGVQSGMGKFGDTAGAMAKSQGERRDARKVDASKSPQGGGGSGQTELNIGQTGQDKTESK
jgi:defect-in-organelle-trafficking protein DotA